jgi:hypothetical protein
LWKISRYSKIAFASSTRVRQIRRSRSSTCIRLQNDSIIALSKQLPTVPIESMRPESSARLVNAQDVNWVPWSEWMTVPSGWRLSIAMPRALVTRAAISIDEHHRAVHLALSCRVLGDVGDPQAVGFVAPEPAFHEVTGRRDVRDPPEARTSRHAGGPGSAHEQLDRTPTDEKALAQDELRVDATSPVAGPAVEVHPTDQLGDECVPDRRSRGWAIMLGVVAGFRDREHAAGEQDGAAYCGHHFDRREAPFGPLRSVSSSEARRWISSSASSSRIRRLAAVSSARSGDVRPGTSPRSICSWRRQVDRLIADTEIAGNIGDLAPGLDEIHDPTPELGRVTPSSHGCLVIETGGDIQLSDSTKGGAHQLIAAEALGPGEFAPTAPHDQRPGPVSRCGPLGPGQHGRGLRRAEPVRPAGKLVAEARFESKDAVKC